MIRRVPIVATALVALAVVTMVALGVWQWGRAHERDAAIAGMVSAMSLPLAEYPYARPADHRLLYRRLSASCDRVTGWQVRGGEDSGGGNGWRHIATCVNRASGAAFLADMGTTSRPDTAIDWKGGTITGRAVRAPDRRAFADRLLNRASARDLMVVAEQPAPGLRPSKQPDPSEETNRSWAYVGQWFLFALTALVIYALALRKRLRAAPPRA